MSKPIVICIIGPSGSGKDTAAAYLEREMGYNRICSYTTRPMREDEKDGREHLFVKEPPMRLACLAYTQYGGYEYWTEYDQLVLTKPNVYVIDEHGMETLWREHKHDYWLMRIDITADEKVRRMRGVTEDRIKRDNERTALPPRRCCHAYWEIANDYSEISLWHTLDSIAENCFDALC